MTSHPKKLPKLFANLAGANLAAQSAEQLSLAAVPILAVMLLGAGPGEIGLLATLQTLPFLLLSIPIGLLADRSSRKRLMVVAESLRALSLIAMLIATITGHLSIPLLALLGFIGATGTVGFNVAAPALVPALVPHAQLAQANGRLELARSTAFAAGPALAGAMVAWAGASSAFVLAAALSVGAVLLLWRLTEPLRTPTPSRHPLLELKDGAHFVWKDKLLKPILLCAVLWNVSWFILQAAYVPYAMHNLGLDASAVGITLGCYGTGMVLGALFASRVIGAMKYGHAVLVGPVVSVISMGAMVLTIWVPLGFLAGFAFFLFGLGPVVWIVTSTTLRQTLTPSPMLGRVTAIFLTVNMGARPFGAAIGGLIGSAWGAPTCLVVALFGFIVAGLFLYASPIKGLEQLPSVRT